MKKIKFKIDHLDARGQGVSKIDGEVVFIKKTLPSEEGEAFIYREAKGVKFAYVNKIEDITKFSTKRIEPKCKHYQKCNACCFMHTGYKNELNLKKEAVVFWLKKLNSNIDFDKSLKVIGAQDRFYYRNRIQLHYDSRMKLLGYINPETRRYIEVDDCLLPLRVIKEKLKDLYKNKEELFRINQGKGHVELISRDDENVEIFFNKDYSHGGFLQVNTAMNFELKKVVKECSQKALEKPVVLDLFGGSGNLSENIDYAYRYVVDSNFLDHSGERELFVRVDLLKSSPESIVSKIDRSIDLLILDPPRAGFKGLKRYLEFYRPKQLIYVSCNIATMVRDLSEIKNYDISESKVVDIFPLTGHFETVLLMTRNH